MDRYKVRLWITFRANVGYDHKEITLIEQAHTAADAITQAVTRTHDPEGSLTVVRRTLEVCPLLPWEDEKE